MSRGELLATHTTTEMEELRALDARGEIGERRMDRRFAKLTMHLVACWASRRSGAVRLQDYLLAAIDDVEDELSEDEELRRFDAGARGHHHAG